MPCQRLLDLAERHRQRGEPHLRAVVQVAFDAAQPRRRLLHRLGSLLLQVSGAFGGCETILQRDVVGAPAGRGIAEHPGCDERRSERCHRQQSHPTVAEGPAVDRDTRADQAEEQPGQRLAPWPAGGERVEEHQDRRVCHGRLQRADRRLPGRPEAQCGLRQPDDGGHAERHHRVPPSQRHGQREQHVDSSRGEGRADGRDPELARAAGQQRKAEQTVGHQRMPADPRVRQLQHGLRIGRHRRTDPVPAIVMSCAWNGLVSLHAGPSSQTSSRLTVSVKAPLMPR